MQLITNKKNFYNKVINKRIFLKNKFHLSIVIDSVVFVFFFRNCNLLHKEHFTITNNASKSLNNYLNNLFPTKPSFL